jgi:hypothetical protein
MALSQTEIVNLALTRLGQDRVISIGDDVEAARIMRSLWDMTRDTVLAGYPWKFAIKRTSLPALADAPAYGWARQFAVPEECLRLVQVGEDYVFYTGLLETFQLEGGVIMTDEAAPLRLRYVQRVTNVGLWPVLFGRVVAMQLAIDACEKLTTSSAKQGTLNEAYALAVAQARKQSAIERPPQRADNSDWLNARGD